MDKLSLSVIGFMVIMSLFAIGFVLDAFSQFDFAGHYEMPVYLIEFCRLALQSALGAGAFAALREARKKNAEKKSDNSPPLELPDADTSSPGRRGEKKGAESGTKDR